MADRVQLVDASHPEGQRIGRPRRGDRRPIGIYLPIELRDLMDRAAEARGLRSRGDLVAEIVCAAHGLAIPDYIERDRKRPENTDDSLFDHSPDVASGRITAPAGLRYTTGMVNIVVSIPVDADKAIRQSALRDDCSISQHVVPLLTAEFGAPPVVLAHSRPRPQQRTDGGQLAMGA